MLRLFLFVILITLAIVPFVHRSAQTTELLRRVTNSPDQALNLNPILSDDGRSVIFESSIDLAEVGGPGPFHAIRVDVFDDAVHFEQIASSRLPSATVNSDGSKIAFASTEDLTGENSDRNSEIFLWERSGLRQITNTHPDREASRLADGNFSPSLSSDGRWIAFSSNRNLTSAVNSEIFLFDCSEKKLTQLTQSGFADSTNPKLSGDGSRVFFIERKLGQDSGQLMLLDINTRTIRALASDIDGLTMTNGRAISRDGNRIVYSALTAPNESQVFLFDINDNRPRQLTQLGSRSSDVNLNATISGDGKRIAFATRRQVTSPSDGSVELYLLDLPTGEIQQITNAPTAAAGEVVASLNYDGSMVAFSFPRVLSAPVSDSTLANNSEIYLASLDPRPEFGKASVGNAASGETKASPVAPGSIAMARGHQLSSGSEQAKLIDGNLPLTMKGTSVAVNGHRARLFYASPEEVVFLVPPDVVAGPAEVIVTNSEGFPSRATVNITRTAPGVFSDNGQAIMLNAASLTASPFNPTDGPLSVSLFATGVRNASTVSVNIAGESVEVEAILPSTLPGLDEIHLLLPASLRGAGNVPVVVRTNDSDSDAVNTVIAGSSLRDIMINEVLADPPVGLAGDANHDGTRDSAADEFVELVNSTARDVNLTGYELQTRSLSSSTDTVRHRFGPGTILAAGTAFVIFGGGTIDKTNAAFGGAQVVKASSGGLSLSNSGAVVILRDPTGLIVTSMTYGGNSGLAGDANQSITRLPDITGQLVLHQLASDMRPFSPGTQVNGQPFIPSPAVKSIVVTPTRASLLKGSQFQFSAKAFGAENNELSDVIFNWFSNSHSIVTIDSDGLAKAIAPGSATLFATARGIQSETAVVDVTAPTPTPTPTPSPTPSPSPSTIPTPTPVASPTPSPVGSPSPTPSPTVSPTPSPSPNPPPLLISEFRTRGPNGASDEFVEIYNNSDAPINAAGLKVRGSSGSGTITTRLTINANTIIPARGHFLAINSSGYSGSVSGDQTFTSGFANDGGIALTLSDDTVIDQVGMSAGSAFKEGLNLTPLPTDSNQGYERKPGRFAGSTQDTADNATDFQILSPSDPQNRSSSPTPGPGPSPSPTPGITPSPSPTPSATPTPSPSPSNSTGVVISQVFGGGGNSGSPLRNDFIEIFNAGTSPVNLSGWSVQYASATGSTWSVTPLTATDLAPGQYYLIQEASGGSNGVTLATPDATGSISLAAASGKVALVRTTTALAGSCPVNANVVDFVGYGTTANCFEGTAPSPAASNTMAVARKGDGCIDSAQNVIDFALSAPSPRNTSTALHTCSNLTNTASLIAEAFWLVLTIVATL